ncbi:hypothetical protein [Mycolicibacterium sphagni]|nr:hypothetical protein [Mycolicibacterium sphagni]
MTAERRRALKAERIAAYVEKVVADAPPLTVDQKSRLAAIFRSGG